MSRAPEPTNANEMANEITIQYALPDPMPQARESWKQNPPEWLADSKGKFELVDETYNGLVSRGKIGRAHV